jgi:hypothetical protein
MKYLISYNESIRDFLKPKSNDQIDKELLELSNYDIIEKSLEYNYLNGLKIVVNNNLSEVDIDVIINFLNRNTSKEIYEYLLSIDKIKKDLIKMKFIY